ncbi:MAG: transcription-repair coupling factor [Paludibacteraceae bacterium]|nr:transcription-repair coupling factor [Paludibacteraceae bacterium]
MQITEFLEYYRKHPLVKEACSWMTTLKGNVAVEGVQGSMRSLLLAAMYRKASHSVVVVLDNEEEAAYCYHDLAQLYDRQKIAFFPSAYRNIHKHGAIDEANEILRADTLSRLQQSDAVVVVTFADAISEKVVAASGFNSAKIELHQGDTVSVDDLVERLDSYGFQQMDFVYEPGQYSLRGSILDIFSFSNEQPYRIDFFGNDIDSIRVFDIEKQLSVEKRDNITIVPNIDEMEGDLVSLLEFVDKDNTILYLKNSMQLRERLDAVYDEALVKANQYSQTSTLESRLLTGEDFKKQTAQFRCMLEGKSALKVGKTITFNLSPQPLFHKNFDLVTNCLSRYMGERYNIYIASDSVKQTDRIAAIFKDRGDYLPFNAVLKTLHEGFIDHDMKCCFFTDHQIFDRFHKFVLKSDSARSGKVAMTLKELNQFRIGDYVVHIDHGVGKFGGLLTTEINGKPQEVVKLVYKDGDNVFVSIHSLHKISKYKSKEGEEPRINKIGSGAWERLKERTKSKVKDIARDLIKLYAQRMSKLGFAFSPDGYLQQELEASFIYEDTPDQLKATADIKHDMELPQPMDRLVCGDVGFGKTEVAIRAAFKAVTDGKQVAVLVPTTVLALQHYKSFSERLQLFPCRVEYISRAKTAKQVKEILKELADGKIDILVGTHKLVGKDVVFKDLGLLIIDEEQKFGVSVKEKLKQMKVDVDTLTLTATPIPRTLQFSLMGARDLSIINTPPPNRYPVLTEVIDFDEDIIRDAIVNEMNRNGQVFFIHNRVQSIYTLAEKLKEIVPGIRIAIGHGQMPPQQLEEVIVDFINYEYDLLLATTVVESGIDMPNVNTIIVNKANLFGLSDLHQLRGRVGRSNRKAYCYLIAPEYKEMTDDARRRLDAIATFSDLGSGFNIAMQDLDIRGAGNMLGAEQSGFIADLGYETYQRILNEAMIELRDEEFNDVLPDKQTETAARQDIDFVSDCNIETDFNVMIPNDYVSSVSERMSLYRELDNLTNEEGIAAFRTKLEDRFGAVPEEVDNLIELIRIRWHAIKMGVERLVLKNGKMTMYFVSNTNSPFYKSEIFGKMLVYMTKFPKNVSISQANNKRSMTISPVSLIGSVNYVFNKIEECQIS